MASNVSNVSNTSEATECAICIEKFNAVRRKRIVCPYCPTDGTETPYCAACAKTYLLQDDAHTPRCAACRSGWTEDYMTQTFAKTWLLKEYKAHREAVLLDVERARLPEAQEDAARYRRALAVQARFRPQLDPLLQRLKELPEIAVKDAAHTVYNTAWRTRHTAERHGPGEAPVRREDLREAESVAWRALREAQTALANAQTPITREITLIYNNAEYRQAMGEIARIGKEVQRAAADAGQQRERRQWTFVMKCPLPECQGFVGTDWRCGLCEETFCKECGESNKPEEGREEHACNPDTTATFKAMRKEAKPCPKCAAMISKIDGCDQMWCTQCQTAFSWRTGQIEATHIHNPHYFQWLRQTNNGEAPPPRIPVGDCLNLGPEELLDQVQHFAHRRSRTAATTEKQAEYQIVMMWIRNIRHFRYVHADCQARLRVKQDDEWRRQLRVKRLVGEITDAIWKDRLQRGEKAAQKHYAVVQVLELYCQAGLDFMRQTLPDDADLPAILDQLQALRKFCNMEMVKIQKRYNSDVVYLDNPVPTGMHDAYERVRAMPPEERARAEAQLVENMPREPRHMRPAPVHIPQLPDIPAAVATAAATATP